MIIDRSFKASPCKAGSMYLINILTKSESGLAVDAQIIESALPFPEFIAKTVYVDRPLHHRMLDRLSSRRERLRFGNRSVINLHCEQISESYLPLADYNVLIPNQEWTRTDTIKLTARMDAIFCKSRYAAGIYQQYGPTVFVGFSSPDRLDTSIAKDYNQFLHLAGKSKQKGTRSLAMVWSRHPEWPVLNLVSRRKGLLDGLDTANINVIDYLEFEDMRALQNRCGIHLCPSEAEGYGHSIGEGMSTGALLMTTDAPPMHELVESSRGILVAFGRHSKQGLGSNFYVDETALEAAILRMLSMNQQTREAMSQTARKWFIANQQAFAERLRQALRTLAAPAFTDGRSHGASGQ